VLTPGRYVGAEEVADDGEPSARRWRGWWQKLTGQFVEGAKLEKAIKGELEGAWDYGGVGRWSLRSQIVTLNGRSDVNG